MSEQEQFLINRREIIIFVQQIWQRIKQINEIKRNDEDPSHITNPSKKSFPDRGYSNDRNHNNNRRRRGYETGTNGF